MHAEFIERLGRDLDGQSRRSLHLVLVRSIQDAVTTRLLQPGDALPSERELTTALKISRTVIRRAISTLEAEGILSTRHGQGSFVPKDFRRSTNSALGFSEEMTRRGRVVSNTIVRDIIRRPSGSEAIDLGLNPESDLRELVRIRFSDGDPIAHELALVPVWALASEFDGMQSLYAAMEATGTRPVRVLQEISAVATDEAVATSLGVSTAAPALKIIRKGYDAANVVVEFTTTFFRSDRYSWVTELRR